jgi:cation:H+ antiporter
VTLGYGSVILVATTKLSKKPVENVLLSKHTQIDAIYLAVTAIIAYILAWIGGGLSVADGIILAVLFFIYVVQHYIVARKHSLTVEHNVTTRDMLKAIGMLIVGGAVILLVSERFVESMKHIAAVLQVSTAAVAIILSPIASELPEKITAYMTVMRNGKNAEISVCNFMGSKVNHNSLLLAVLPFVGLAIGKPVKGVIDPAFMIMTGLTLVAGVSLARRRLERWQGWLFVTLYLSTILAAFLVRAKV